MRGEIKLSDGGYKIEVRFHRYCKLSYKGDGGKIRDERGCFDFVRIRVEHEKELRILLSKNYDQKCQGIHFEGREKKREF